MNRVFTDVLNVAEQIRQKMPADGAKYHQEIEAARQARREAEAAREEAETVEQYNAACEASRRAEEREKFFQNRLKKIQFTPRMDEGEYFAHVETVQKEMDKAAAEFRKTALKAVRELVEARKKYEETAAEADQALAALDDAANVLQVLYRYQEMTFIGRNPELIEDADEWRSHAVRYSAGVGYGMAIDGDNDEKEQLRAAWAAADRADLTPRDMWGRKKK